ncbi:hypothetical protein M3Y99_01000100 [Aphelenchoides fujianensis]|nr:hypothetical protein M3Y99_01000100 [Aphelenchoides fujianensis]
MPPVVQLSLFVLFQLFHSTAGYRNDGPPTLLVRPDSKTVIQDTAVVLFCRALGEPLPNIMWLVDGHLITDSRYKIKTLPNALSILRIEPVRPADGNQTFSCTAENGIGSPVKAEARLTVVSKDELPAGFPSIDAHPVMKSVESGRTAHLSCRVHGEPVPRILWLKNSIPLDIRANPRYSVSTMGNPGALMIQKASEEDQGRFECVASNEKGVVHSKAVHLFVKGERSPSFHIQRPIAERQNPPYFSFKLPHVHKVPTGGAVNLTCVAVGFPMPRVFWKRESDGVVLNDPQTAPIGKNVLTVTDVRKTETYKCVAVSKLGSIGASTMVEPEGPYVPVPPPQNLRVNDVNTSTVVLRWDPPTVADEKIVKFVHYEFTVQVETESGKRSAATLPVEAHTAEQPPEAAPHNLQLRPLRESGSVLVEWAPPDEGAHGRITGYKLMYTDLSDEAPEEDWRIKEITTKDFATTLTGLNFKRPLFVRVKALNSKGASPWSEVAKLVISRENGEFP